MSEKDEIKFTITVNVTYEAETVGDPDLHARSLTNEMNRVIGEGLLSPSWDEVVEEYDMEVRYEGDTEQVPT